MVFLFDPSCTEDAEAGSGMGVELLVDFGGGDAGEVRGQEGEEGVAQEGEGNGQLLFPHGRSADQRFSLAPAHGSCASVFFVDRSANATAPSA